MIKKIKEGIYWVGALDPSRKFFDEIVPLPDGTTYNSYFIQGSNKNVLIDGVDPSKVDILLQNLDEIGVKTLDFVVSQHAEQDHSGAIPKVLEKFPEAKLVTNLMAKKLLQDLFEIPDEKFKLIKNGDELKMGDRTLKFILAAWVHWPETMFTHLLEDNILFTCDLFGSHFSTENLFSEDNKTIEDAAKRYYAEIMMPFATFVKKHTAIVRELNPKIIAPSHGPIYKNPNFILKLHEEWTSEKTKNQVVIAWVSMHDSTKKMVDYLETSLKAKNIRVIKYNLAECDSGALAMDLVDSRTIILASPMFLGSPHPLAFNAANLVGLLKPKTKFLGIISSFGWSNQLVVKLDALMKTVKAERLEPVLVKGTPKKEDFNQLEILAKTIAEKHFIL